MSARLRKRWYMLHYEADATLKPRARGSSPASIGHSTNKSLAT
jgi:hypothetical protein